MKTQIIILVLLFASLTFCTNPSRPLSDNEKDKIKAEVKEVVNTMLNAAQEGNIQKAMECWLESPDFTINMNGNSMSHHEFMEAMKPLLNSLVSQKGTFVNEKYSVLDNSTVIYSSNSKWVVNLKDGSSILQEPWAMLYTFKKIDGKWKLAACAEAGVEKNIPGSSPKELNQAELHKQFSGSWKCESTKDTIGYWDLKPFGTGVDCYFKYVTKGNTVFEARQLWGYDKDLDKCIIAELIKGMDLMIYASWFTSKNKGLVVPKSDINNPDNASIKWEFEFKSNDSYGLANFVNNKLVKTEVWNRIK
jgi:hypothetical protein